jgi:hypothetical protein
VEPFRARIKVHDHDSVQHFEHAARRNYRDAEVLRRANRRLGAIYLYGYSVENALKAAYFRALFNATGRPITTAVDKKLRNTEWDLRSKLNLPTKPKNDPENQHDINIWALLLAWRRHSLRVPYAPPFAQEVTDRAAELYKN